MTNLPRLLSGDNEGPWILPNILVNLHRSGEDNSLGVVRELLPDHWKLLCSICGVSYGTCIQNSVDELYFLFEHFYDHFHVTTKRSLHNSVLEFMSVPEMAESTSRCGREAVIFIYEILD